MFLQRTNYYETNDDIGDYLFNILSIDAHCNYPFRILFFNTGCLINLTWMYRIITYWTGAEYFLAFFNNSSITNFHSDWPYAIVDYI